MNFFSKSTVRSTLSMSSGLTFLKKFLVLVVGEICGLWNSSRKADVGVGRAEGGICVAESGGPPWLLLPSEPTLPVGDDAQSVAPLLLVLIWRRCSGARPSWAGVGARMNFLLSGAWSKSSSVSSEAAGTGWSPPVVGGAPATGALEEHELGVTGRLRPPPGPPGDSGGSCLMLISCWGCC